MGAHAIAHVAHDLRCLVDLRLGSGELLAHPADVLELADGAVVPEAAAVGIELVDRERRRRSGMENIPGIAFEEVSVKTINKTLNGPLGPVEGGLIAGELHMDATSENKTFAPAYGEFLTSGAGDVEALALAVPTNALAEAEPDELSVLLNGASGVLNAAENGNWKAASATVGEMSNAWQRYPSSATPTRIAPRMTAALKELGRVVRDRNSAAARQAAIEATLRPLADAMRGPLAAHASSTGERAMRVNAAGSSMSHSLGAKGRRLLSAGRLLMEPQCNEPRETVHSNSRARRREWIACGERYSIQ